MYQVILKDSTGLTVANIDSWISASISHRVNDPGSVTLSLGGDDPRIPLFEENGILEFWRAWPEYGIGWYLEKEALITDPGNRSTDEAGGRHYDVAGVGFVDLLRRRVIAWQVDSDQAWKSDYGGTVMRAYVRENLGDLALSSSGRHLDGTLEGLTIGTGSGEGAIWEGDRAGRNLLEVLQEIALAAGCDFDVIGTGRQLSVYVWRGAQRYIPSFEFRVYADQRGEDLSVDSGVGSESVVFALNRGNMAVPAYTLSYANEVNAVVVLGAEYAGYPLVSVRTRSWRIVPSKINQREVTRNEGNEENYDGLDAAGDAELAAGVPAESFTWEFVQIPGCLYGRDYHCGDKVTGRYDDIERSKRLTSIDITLEAPSGGAMETIKGELQDVP